jgi:hypothetical protein
MAEYKIVEEFSAEKFETVLNEEANNGFVLESSFFNSSGFVGVMSRQNMDLELKELKIEPAKTPVKTSPKTSAKISAKIS